MDANKRSLFGLRHILATVLLLVLLLLSAWTQAIRLEDDLALHWHCFLANTSDSLKMSDIPTVSSLSPLPSPSIPATLSQRRLYTYASPTVDFSSKTTSGGSICSAYFGSPMLTDPSSSVAAASLGVVPMGGRTAITVAFWWRPEYRAVDMGSGTVKAVPISLTGANCYTHGFFFFGNSPCMDAQFLVLARTVSSDNFVFATSLVVSVALPDGNKGLFTYIVPLNTVLYNVSLVGSTYTATSWGHIVLVLDTLAPPVLYLNGSEITLTLTSYSFLEGGIQVTKSVPSGAMPSIWPDVEIALGSGLGWSGDLCDATSASSSSYVQTTASSIGGYIDSIFVFRRRLNSSEVGELVSQRASLDATVLSKVGQITGLPCATSQLSGSACVVIPNDDGQVALPSNFQFSNGTSNNSSFRVVVQSVPDDSNQCDVVASTTDFSNQNTIVSFLSTGMSGAIVSYLNGKFSVSKYIELDVRGRSPSIKSVVQSPPAGFLATGGNFNLTLYTSGFPRPTPFVVDSADNQVSYSTLSPGVFVISGVAPTSRASNSYFKVQLSSSSGSYQSDLSLAIGAVDGGSTTGDPNAFAWPVVDSGESSSLAVALGAALGSVGGLALLTCCLGVCVVCGVGVGSVALLLLAVVICIVAVVLIAVVVALLALAVAIASGIGVITVRLAKRFRRIKLPKPDYMALAYGSYLGTMFDGPLGDYDELAAYLLRSDMEAITAICGCASATDVDDLTKSLVYLFASEQRALDVMRVFIADEVTKSTSEGTLFRQNSVSSKMFNSYARLVGLPFVFGIFALPVNILQADAKHADKQKGSGSEGTEMSALSGPMTMELDPTKLSEASDAKVNTLQLWLVAERLLSALLKSAPTFPPEFSSVLNDVNTLVSQKYTDEEAFRGMGGFLFLRFLCPALMAPHFYGLLKDAPHETVQRQLILLGKVLQNLANNTLPGKKEAYMERLNSFIADNHERLVQFYASVCANAGGVATATEVPDAALANSLAQIHCFLHSQRKKVVAGLEGAGQPTGDLTRILDDLGEPPAKVRKAT